MARTILLILYIQGFIVYLTCMKIFHADMEAWPIWIWLLGLFATYTTKPLK